MSRQTEVDSRVALGFRIWSQDVKAKAVLARRKIDVDDVRFVSIFALYTLVQDLVEEGLSVKVEKCEKGSWPDYLISLES